MSLSHMRPWQRWLIYFGVSLGAAFAVLSIVASILSKRIEPYVKEKTAAYLRERFASELSWENFQIQMSLRYPVIAFLRHGKGAAVGVEIDGVVLRHRGRTDIAPLLSIRKLTFDVDVADALATPARVHQVRLEGLELTIPPKGSRPQLTTPKPDAEHQVQGLDRSSAKEASGPTVIIDEVRISQTDLKILPKDSWKPPLQFDIYDLRLEGAGDNVAMRYNATLKNAKPPGLIRSVGNFGPWNADEPGDTPLKGDYSFRDADLDVFKGIAGILSSTGNFDGELDEITVDGETDTPDFRLDKVNNHVPLHTKFHAVVDGTNGNTFLEPVEAVLGKTRFVASGGVVKNKGDPARAISLDVMMEKGQAADLLRLAMNGNKAILEGGVNLKMKFDLLPEKGELADRLRLKGTFELLSAHFTDPDVQGKVDSLSRRGQGKPKDLDISKVASNFVGDFSLDRSVFTLNDLQFDVPGALVELAGEYKFEDEALDLHGKLRLQAKLSKTMTGWKRIFLKPVDPFFAKEGVGTVVGIKVTGTRQNPDFGLD